MATVYVTVADDLEGPPTALTHFVDFALDDIAGPMVEWLLYDSHRLFYTVRGAVSWLTREHGLPGAFDSELAVELMQRATLRMLKQLAHVKR